MLEIIILVNLLPALSLTTDIFLSPSHAHSLLVNSVTSGCMSNLLQLAEVFHKDVNQRDDNGHTPLHYAAQRGQMEMVQFLAERSHDKICQANDGLSPLFFAVNANQLQVVQYLLKNYPAMNLPNNRNDWPINIAAKRGYYQIAKELLTVQHPLNSVKSALFTALQTQERTNIAKLILYRFPELKNSQNTFGSLPIHLAASKGHVELVKLLTAELDADACPKDAMNELTPFHFAAAYGKLDIVQLYINQNLCNNSNPEGGPIGKTPLHLAVAIGDIDIVDLILNNSEEHNPTTADDEASTPFIYAVAGGHLRLVQHMCHNWGCDPLQRVAMKDYELFHGNTAIHVAFSKNQYEVAAYLMSLTPEKNPANHYGYTSLHLAALMGDFQAVKLITDVIEVKNPDSRNDSIVSPMHLAAASGQYDIVNFYLDLIPNYNPVTKFGMTCLHFAARNGHLDLVRLLVNRVPNQQVYSSVTVNSPAELAFLYGHIEVAVFLDVYNEEQSGSAMSGHFLFIVMLLRLLFVRLLTRRGRAFPTQIMAELS